MTARRLSQAISLGDGISVLVEVGGVAEARRAEDAGAGAVVVRTAHADLRSQTTLPLLAYGLGPDTAAGAAADGVVLTAAEGLADDADRCRELDLEPVVRIRDDEELERILEDIDPEIVLLSAELADDEQGPLDRLLELLQDVPAGKLAIAELSGATREDVEELERAGVDAVLVTGDIEALVGEPVPDV